MNYSIIPWLNYHKGYPLNTKSCPQHEPHKFHQTEPGCCLHWAQCPTIRRSLRRLWTPVSKPRETPGRQFGIGARGSGPGPCLGWFGVKVGRDETSQITFLSVLEDEMLCLTSPTMTWWARLTIAKTKTFKENMLHIQAFKKHPIIFPWFFFQQASINIRENLNENRHISPPDCHWKKSPLDDQQLPTQPWHQVYLQTSHLWAHLFRSQISIASPGHKNNKVQGPRGWSMCVKNIRYFLGVAPSQ